MVRLEFFQVEQNDLKDFLNDWIKGGTFTEKYTDKDNKQVIKQRVSKNRIYFGSNFSIRINQDEKGKYWISLEFLGADDRIKLNSINKGDVF